MKFHVGHARPVTTVWCRIVAKWNRGIQCRTAVVCAAWIVLLRTAPTTPCVDCNGPCVAEKAILKMGLWVDSETRGTNVLHAR
jgi:hypothetical protein